MAWHSPSPDVTVFCCCCALRCWFMKTTHGEVAVLLLKDVCSHISAYWCIFAFTTQWRCLWYLSTAVIVTVAIRCQATRLNCWFTTWPQSKKTLNETSQLFSCCWARAQLVYVALRKRRQPSIDIFGKPPKIRPTPSLTSHRTKILNRPIQWHSRSIMKALSYRSAHWWPNLSLDGKPHCRINASRGHLYSDKDST